VPRQDHTLSPRELAVVKLLLEGKSNKQIALQLGITEGTVKNHVASIMRKLKAANRTDVVVKWLRGEDVLSRLGIVVKMLGLAIRFVPAWLWQKWVRRHSTPS
jgi:DNA-binding CsgD family transcriptional regulator